MAMEARSPQENPDSLRAQSGAVVTGVRAAVLHTMRHLEALAELLQLELREYGRIQMHRAGLMLVGAVLLLVGYVFLWLAAIIVCDVCWGRVAGYIALGSAFVFNILAGLCTLVAAMRRKPESVAPATCQEIKDDLQCIKLYLRGKEKS